MNPKFHSLTIKDVRKETKDAVSISFEMPTELIQDFQFSAGQYLTFKTLIDKEEVRRSYSLCSSPNENEWRVAIKEIENGKFSRFANHSLKKGSVLEVMMPTGNFKLKTTKGCSKSYVLFAAGSGITPIFSILKTAAYFCIFSCISVLIYDVDKGPLENLILSNRSINY